MTATASSDFPFLDKWKQKCDENAVLGFFDSIISGYAQIAFNDNSFSGLLLIIATYIGSPIQAISGVWATFVATLTAYILGIPRDLIRAGLYGINPALAGLAIPALVFPNASLNFQLFLYSTIAAVFAVFLTASLNQFLSKWNVPALALPYSITLFVFVPASIILRNLNASISAPAVIEIVGNHTQDIWTLGEFLTATMNGIAQVVWVDSVITGILYLVAVFMASRIDVISTIIGSLVGTWVAVALGVPKDLIFIGLYGYNAVLLMKAMTRGYRLSIYSYTFAIILAGISSLLTAAMRVIFAPIGAISPAAFPYAILCILAFMSRSLFKNLKYVPPKYWGVPETIRQIPEDKVEQ